MNLMLPKIDFAFKLLFGDQRSKNILADFLKAVLPSLADEEFEELTITDPQLKREFSGDKLEILDVKLRTGGGRSLDIEIQVSDIPEMRSRISYYLSNMITEQIGMGGHYVDLKQAVSIVITDYDFIPESARCHTVFQMLEREEYFPFNDLMEIHVLNLERLPPDGEGKLMDWLRFLKAETEEEFKMIAEKNPVIHEAYCKLQVMSEDEANRMIYEARLKAQRDDYSRMNGALQKGLREGIQKGLEEGELKATRKIVLEMGKKGLDIKTIAAVTHVSEQQINDILKEKI
ncbi:MAG: Rpn family recombination-promoting nuclease/putative transposase [Spirochaetaceae bacterium]|jgi:predicted transposase/invertase (TIGR01784 family)|nr:Rpn family recombination-promoting nuclease/putative transposase [Spirochaetaceae bacterium]